METPFGPTFEDDIKQILAEVPAPIRAFFASGKVQIVAKNLMQKYQFHIDQGAIVEREIIMLLLGINNPDEFIKALVEEAKLDQKTIDGIIQDINAQIFMPLREEEMKSGGVKTEPSAKPAMPPAAWRANVPPAPRPPQINVSVPSYASRPFEASQPAGVVGPPLQSPKYFHLEDKIDPLLIKVIPEIKHSPVIPTPSLKVAKGTAIAGEKLLEDHEESHINLDKSSVPINLPGTIPLITVPEIVVP
jgi:hypothetical protein